MANFLLKKHLSTKGVFHLGGQILVGALFLILVYLLMAYQKNLSIGTASQLSEETLAKLNSDPLLTNFLKEKSDYPGAENTADLLRLYYLTNDEAAFNKAKELAENYFSTSYLESELTSWSLSIYKTAGNVNSKQIDGKSVNILKRKFFISYEEIPINTDLIFGNIGIELYYISK